MSLLVPELWIMPNSFMENVELTQDEKASKRATVLRREGSQGRTCF